MSRPPALQFFCKDWIAKCQGLSLEEEGAYVRLFNAARTTSEDWCSLPDDDRRLARIVGVSLRKWKKLRSVLVPQFFIQEGGMLVNQRLKEEAAIQIAFRDAGAEGGKATRDKTSPEERSRRAKAAADARWGAHNDMRSQCAADARSASASALEPKTLAAATATPARAPDLAAEVDRQLTAARKRGLIP